MGRETGRWSAKRGQARAIRIAVAVLPFVAALAATFVTARVIPDPASVPGVVAWAAAIVLSGVLAALVVERIALRFLPFAALLDLALVFPDRAPSRFEVARRAWSVRSLERTLHEAQHDGLDDEPTRAVETILALVTGLGEHDRRTRGHSERVRVFADMIAEELDLDDRDRERLRWSALLHDVGKVAVPHEVLNKPAKPTDEEWEQLRQHPSVGAKLTAPLHPWLGEWAAAVEHHHERFDGTGYPNGFQGEDISLGGRIVAVADAYEVMTVHRSYRAAMTPQAAREELALCAGTHFDPAIVRAFLRIAVPRLTSVLKPVTAGLPAGLQQVLERVPRFDLPTAAIAGLVAVGSTGFAPLLSPPDRDARSDEPVFAAQAPASEDRAGTAPDAVALGPSAAPTPAPVSPSPTPTPTPTPSPSGPSPSPSLAVTTPTPVAVEASPPAPSPTPAPTVSSPTPSPAAASAVRYPRPGVQPIANRYTLRSSGPRDLPWRTLALTAAGPSHSGTTLPDFDRARDPAAGLTILPSEEKDDETSGDRSQRWALRYDRDVTFDGEVSLTYWSALAGFASGDYHVDAWLLDCDPSGVCDDLEKAHTTDDMDSSGGWVQRTISFGKLSHDLVAGHELVLLLVPDDQMSAPLWLAYDSAAYASRLDFASVTPM